LNVWQNQVAKPSLQTAATAAFEILNEYYKKSLATRHSWVATICDPRYKLALFGFMFEADGGQDSVQYKKGKAHFHTSTASMQGELESSRNMHVKQLQMQQLILKKNDPNHQNLGRKIGESILCMGSQNIWLHNDNNLRL
jgi:hypothetical protein